MRYYPVFLDLRDKLCVVVGGGRVAERKVRSLLQAGAEVKVIGPELTGPLTRLRDKGRIMHAARPFRLGDLRRAVLAIAATNDRDSNERVFLQARKLSIPVNVVDDPAHSSFIVPSLVKRGDLVMAISTGGQSPALAKTLRRKLQEEIGPEYASFLDLLGRVRRKILPLGLGQRRNQQIFRQLARGDLLPLIRKKDAPGVERRLRRSLGPQLSKELTPRW